MRVLITREIPEIAYEILKNAGIKFDVIKDENGPTYEKLESIIGDYEGVLCLLSDKIDNNMIDKGKKLKVIANYAVGYNNIDVAYAKSKGIVCTNTPDVLTDATAEFAISLMFSAARLVLKSDRYIRNGKFDGWKPKLHLGMDFTKKTLGIVGAGRIGGAVMKKMSGFNMNCIYTARSAKPELDRLGAKKVTLDELIEYSDFISVHTPLTDETRYMFTKDEFKKMKSNCVFVNTARGPVVKEEDLVWALENNEIFSAGLDVFEEEPVVNPGLMKLDNVVMAAHIGSATMETRDAMAVLAANSFVCFKNEELPDNMI